MAYICSNLKTTSTLVSNDSSSPVMVVITVDLIAAIHNLTSAMSALNAQVQSSTNKTTPSHNSSVTFSGVMALIDNFVSIISGILDIFVKGLQTVMSWRQLVHLRQLQHLPLLALIYRQANLGVGRPRRADIAMV